MPTIFELLTRFDFLRGLPAATGILVTAVIIVAVWDWRLNVLALAVQYLAAGLLFVDILDPRLAIIKVLVGLFICLMLYFTARQVNWGYLPEDVSPAEAGSPPGGRQMRFGPFRVSANFPLRLFLAVAAVLAVWYLVRQPQVGLPAVSGEALNLAILGLIGLGLLGLGLTTEPLKAGLALLMFFTGFELFYNGLEQSVALLAFLAGGNLALALAICYLTQVRHAIVSAEA